jgi:hypothetical protein
MLSLQPDRGVILLTFSCELRNKPNRAMGVLLYYSTTLAKRGFPTTVRGVLDYCCVRLYLVKIVEFVEYLHEANVDQIFHSTYHNCGIYTPDYTNPKSGVRNMCTSLTVESVQKYHNCGISCILQ